MNAPTSEKTFGQRLRRRATRLFGRRAALGAEQYKRASDNGQTANDAPPRPQTALFDQVSMLMRNIVRLVSGVLINSDVAVRRDPRLQKMMRHDPDIMGPLLQRQYAVALLEWDIIAEDEEDETQVEQAKTLKRLINHNFRRWHDYVRHEQEAVWYGPAATNIIYQFVNDTEIAPVRWRPFHSDSLIFTDEGDLGFRVNSRYKGSKVLTENGHAHLLTPLERQSVALHVFMPQGPNFDEAYEARYIYSGRGLRDVVWYQWLIKQTVLQYWVGFSERYGLGIRVGTYPAGNSEARDDMETVMQNLLGDVTVLLPKDELDSYSLEIMDAKEGRARVFADLIEGYLAGQIKELIIGQTATTEATNTGLGSDVGTRHAETFNRIIKFDAMAQADTQTFELIHPLSVMNFGDTPWRPRFEYSLEDVDSEEFMEGVKAFVDMGGEVPTRQVRARLGINEAKGDEETLSRQFEDDSFDGLFGGGGLNFQRTRERARKYRRAMEVNAS